MGELELLFTCRDLEDKLDMVCKDPKTDKYYVFKDCVPTAPSGMEHTVGEKVELDMSFSCTNKRLKKIEDIAPLFVKFLEDNKGLIDPENLDR